MLLVMIDHFMQMDDNSAVSEVV